MNAMEVGQAIKCPGSLGVCANQRMVFRAMRMLILCVGGMFSAVGSGFSVSDVLEKARYAPKMQANATKMLISDLIAVAIYSTNLGRC